MNKEFSAIIRGFKRSLFLISRSEKRFLLLASALMLVAGILTNIPAVILGRLVDSMVGVDNFQFELALPYINSIIAIIIFRELLTIIRKYIIENIATQTEKKQTVSVIKHLLKTDISSIQKQQVGSLHGRVFRSIQGLIKMIKLGFIDFLPVFFSAAAAIFIALYQKPFIASIMILVIPTGLYIIVRQVSSQKGIRIALLRGKEKIDGAVVETLGGIETVRALNTIDHEVEKVQVIAENLRKKEIKHHIYMAFYDSAKYLNEGFFYILVISISILFSTQGVISQGDVLVYSILFMSITSPLREIHRIIDEAHESSIRVNDFYQLINEPVDISFKPQKMKPQKNMSDDAIIEIKNLSYSYPDTNEKVLKNINFKIKKGERIGIAGYSGSGKSSLIKILLKISHNYTGSVYLFNNDLKSISREEIANKIAYIPQNPYIFSGTIRDNITYGNSRTDYTDKEVIIAAKKANIYIEIMKSLGGLDGIISENGKNLSGGQQQRLAIARLILKSPEVFIFDEATSALDNTNEAIIQKNINKLFKGKTILTIAHRLTTLKDSDRIFVFDDGKIVQEGSYKSLSKNTGLFRSFLHQVKGQ